MRICRFCFKIIACGTDSAVKDGDVETDPEERLALPAEIVTEVLMKVPDRTLMQCKTVCKEWHSLISDPLFAMARSRLGTWRLGKFEMQGGNITLCTYDSAANQGRLPVKMSRQFVPVFGNNSELFGRRRLPCLAGSCNGILYIQNPTYDAILLNPAMRSSIWIPPDKLQLRLFRGIATGLGYDHTVDDYKAIVIILEMYGVISMAVFSLRHKLWKINNNNICPEDCQDRLAAAKCIFRDKDGMTSTYDENSKSGHWCGTTVGGSPYWTGRRSDGTPALIRFDVVREEFMDVGLPAELSVRRHAEFEFGELVGRLCVTFKGQNGATLEGWSKNLDDDDDDDDDESSWTKLFSLTPKIPAFKTLKPVAAEDLIVGGGGLASAGQVLMVLDRNLSLSKFNIKDSSSEIICMDLTSGYAHYVDSPTCPW